MPMMCPCTSMTWSSASKKASEPRPSPSTGPAVVIWCGRICLMPAWRPGRGVIQSLEGHHHQGTPNLRTALVVHTHCRHLTLKHSCPPGFLPTNPLPGFSPLLHRIECVKARVGSQCMIQAVLMDLLV